MSGGYEVARQVRALEHFADTILIALTGWGQEDDFRKTLEVGFNHHLVKPVNVIALEALLAEVQIDKYIGVSPLSLGSATSLLLAST